MNLANKRKHNVPELTSLQRQPPQIGSASLRAPRGNNFDEDGENIQDEDINEIQKSLSFIKCKPSLI